MNRQTLILRHATVTRTADGCCSTFTDGSTWGAQPHDTPDYTVIAERCGYSPDAAGRMAYCVEHDVFHHLVGAHFYRGPSPVLWTLAHGGQPDPRAAALEEATVMLLQRWVRAGERPIIGGVDWGALKAECEGLLDG